jgi:CRISPR-associated protein Csd1
MILSELVGLYDRYAQDPESTIPRLYWSQEKVACRIRINEDGELLGITPYTSQDGAKDYREMEVPEHIGRSGVAPKPYFLCDKPSYFFGLDEKRGQERFEASKDLHYRVLSEIKAPAAQAVVRFFDRGVQGERLGPDDVELLSKEGFCVFDLSLNEQASNLVQNDAAVQEAWESYCATKSADEAEGNTFGQCSVTGEEGQLARLFPQVTGFPGANSAGASLVSFNKQSFESYGKTQAYNASISEEAAFKSGQMLKALLNDGKHTVRMGDDVTLVFWSDRVSEQQDAMVAAVLGALAVNSEGKRAEDVKSLDQIRNIARRIKSGTPVDEFDIDARYYLLGLSPNVARLAVRYFFVEEFKDLAANYEQYRQDIEMVGVRSTSLYRLLQQTKAPGRTSKLPSTLLNPCFRAMLKGAAFPKSLMTTVLARMICDHASNNSWDMGERASLLKAYFNRNLRMAHGNLAESEGFSMALNRENENIGYLLGRLFALIERAQVLALGTQINSTVKDRYIGAAASTPARVFPNIMRNCENHISKLAKSKKGAAVNLEREIEEVIGRINGADGVFPRMLDLDDQGAFFIGYYQQRQTFFTKKADQEKPDEAPSVAE